MNKKSWWEYICEIVAAIFEAIADADFDFDD